MQAITRTAMLRRFLLSPLGRIDRMALLQRVGAQIDAGGFEYERAVVPPLFSNTPRGTGGVLVERFDGHVVGVLAFRVFRIGDEVGLARGGSLVARAP